MNFAKHWAATLDDYAIDLAWSPDGTVLAAASQSGGVTLFEAATGAVRQALVGHDDGANCLSWSFDGALLATGGQDGKVKIWDPVGGGLRHEVKLGNAWVEHLAWQGGRGVPDEPRANPARPEDSPYLFAAAGKKLVALNIDGTIAHTFPDAPKTIAALAVRQDGAAVAAAYFGGVCLWDATTFASQKEIPYSN